jgi:site-specific recombinase XerD
MVKKQNTYIVPGVSDPMRLRDAIHFFISARVHTVTHKTLRNNELYLRSLTDCLDNPFVNEISLHDLRRWRSTLFEKQERYLAHNRRAPVRGGYSIYTIKGMVEAVRQLFNWLNREGYLETNVARKLELPTLPAGPPKAITPRDLEKLIETARHSATVTLSARNVALILFLRDTGCRLCGVAGLRLEQLDTPNCRALVWEKGRGGKSKARAVFFTKESQAALNQWLAARPAALPLPGETLDDHVFVAERYPFKPLTEEAIYCVFRALKKRAGITGRVNPHSLRHARAKTMLEHGAPLGVVSRVLGHSDIRVTDAYYGVYAASELQEQYNKYA